MMVLGWGMNLKWSYSNLFVGKKGSGYVDR